MPLFFYLYGSFYKESFNTSDKITYDYKVRAVGTNISLDRFYSNIDPVTVIKDLIKISNPDKDEKIIFVWPEGILPHISQKELINYRPLFKDNFSENHLLAIGINSQSSKNEEINYYNSLSIYDYKLNLLHSYNKINLVPFGEFLPLEDILNKIGLRSITN